MHRRIPGTRAPQVDRDRAFVLPLGPIIPAVALLLCLWMASRASLEAWGLTAALVTAGFALYWLAAGRR